MSHPLASAVNLGMDDKRIGILDESDVTLARPVRVGGTRLPVGGTLRLTWPGPAKGVLETSTNLAPNSWSPAPGARQQPD